MKFSTFLKVVVFGALLLSHGLVSAKTIDVSLKGIGYSGDAKKVNGGMEYGIF